MSKFTAFLIIVFAAISAYLAFYNRETVDVFIGQHTSYEVSKITLMLISASVGALFMLLFYTVRDTKRFINNIQSQRKQKKQQKLSQLYSRAITAAQAGKQEQALSLLKDIVQEDDKHIDALLRLGEIYQQRGSLKEAQDYFKRVITLDGSNANALLRLAEIRLAQGLKEEALELVEEVLREDGQNFTALNLKSEILESLNRWDELVEHLRDVLKRTGSEEERSRIEESLRGYSYELYRDALQRGELERALKGFRSILKQDRDFLPAHLGIAEVRLKEGRTDEAIDYLEEVFRNSGSLVVVARLEELLLKKGDPSRIIALYQDALSGRADSTLKYFLAKLYYRLEMLDDALETLEGIEEQALQQEVSKMRGMIFHKRGQFDRAAEEFITTLNIGSILRVPYRCSNCGYIENRYSGRCPSCKRWNTFTFSFNGTSKVDREQKATGN